MRTRRTRCTTCTWMLGVVGLLVFVGSVGPRTLSGDETPPILEVLNAPPNGTAAIVIERGTPVEVRFAVGADGADGFLDAFQLRRLDDGSRVSQRMRGEALAGTVALDTNRDGAIGWLEVVYVEADGTLAATAEDIVLVVEQEGLSEDALIVPSPTMPTIQTALDRVRDGGTVYVGPGTYEVEQLVVRAKDVTIRGAGSSYRPPVLPGHVRADLLQEGRRGLRVPRSGREGGRRTRIQGPERGGFVPAERATGVLTFLGAGGLVTGVDITGGDACVVGRDLDRGRPLCLRDVTLRRSGRGVLWKSSSTLTVTDSEIGRCAWNGISFAPSQRVPLFVFGVTFKYIGNIGIYIADGEGYVEDALVAACEGGGIVVEHSLFGIVDSILLGNHLAGISLFHSAGVIQGNYVWRSDPIPSGPKAGYFGDGVDAWLCPLVIMTDNLVYESARAGIANFASTMRLGDTRLQCAGFEVEGEPLPADFFGPGEPPQEASFLFVDLGGVLCGCPSAVGPCVVETAGLEPPKPPGSIE